MPPNWKALRHLKGPATRVPTLLKALGGKSFTKRADAFDALRDVLVGTEAWYAASAPAVEALLSGASKAPQPELHLTLAAEILGADHVRAWLLPADAPIPAAAEPTFAAARAQGDFLLAALGAERPHLRAAAALVLAMLPSLAEAARSPLLEVAHQDADEVARASALLALGRLGGSVDPSLDAESPLVRGAAAVARLRADPTTSIEDLAEPLLAWLTYEPPIADPGAPWLPWFGGLVVAWYTQHQPLDATSHALDALLREPKDRLGLAHLCLEHARRHNLGVEARRFGRLVLALGGFLARPPKAVVAFDALSATEQDLARGLATTSLLPIAGHGVVACGASRRRWAGLEPPGPLERPVTVDGEPLPLWHAFMTLRQNGQTTFPPELDDLVTGADRWQAIAELAARTYGTGFPLRQSNFADELARIELDDDLLDRIALVADDLVFRYDAAAREEQQHFLQLAASAWLMLPLAREGRPIEARWIALFNYRCTPLARELFSVWPEERRPEAIAAHLSRVVPPPVVRSQIEEAIHLVDLTPTESTLRAILDAIDAYAEHPQAQVEAVLTKLRAQADAHAPVAKALAAARATRP